MREMLIACAVYRPLQALSATASLHSYCMHFKKSIPNCQLSVLDSIKLIKRHETKDLILFFPVSEPEE